MRSRVWLPSKARSNSPFLRRLLDEGIEFIIWVEPQDEADYVRALGGAHVRVIPENDMGVTYVRQLILDEARKIGSSVFMLDDDMVGFVRFFENPSGGRRQREQISVREALEYAEKRFVESGLVYGCFVHGAFGVFAKPGLNWRKMDYGSIWLDGSRLPRGIDYDGIPGREDLYLAIRLVLAGVPAACDNDVSAVHRPSADPKNSGGLQAWYSNWEQNVVSANDELVRRLDSLRDELVGTLPERSREQFSKRPLYRKYEVSHGPLKGLVDVRPSWSATIKLRNALHEGVLEPI